ncbi:MAG: hypothetical protein DRJ65_00100 [Acidobacteria bacterium]|nr:MAG: hypothetical protein DRJ65_00100 [Acidobacteriota bacterium]
MSKQQGKDQQIEGFDFACLDTSKKAADGVEFELRHPTTGAMLDAFITVVGMDSQAHRDARDKASEKIRRRQSEDGRRANSPSDIDDLKFETAIGDVVGWRGILDLGEEVVFSRPNVRSMFFRFKFMVDQVGEAVYDRSRFLPGG